MLSRLVSYNRQFGQTGNITPCASSAPTAIQRDIVPRLVEQPERQSMSGLPNVYRALFAYQWRAAPHDCSSTECVSA